MFLKAGALSLASLLLSRLLGLARESAQAAAFGTSGLGDVAVLLLTLPDLLAGLLASGALAYVLLPHWAQQSVQQQAASQRRVAIWLLAGGAVLGALLWLAQGPVAAVLAPGVPAPLRPVAAQALVWAAVALPAALLAALWVTRLQHLSDFAGLYAANLVVNGVLIAALVFVAYGGHGMGTVPLLGLVLLAAMGLRLLWLRLRLNAAGVTSEAEAGTAALSLPPASIWLWAVLSAGLPLALPFVARSLASQAGEGALAAFNYAWKLVELPLVLAIQLVAALAFPSITRALARPGAGVADRKEAIQAVRSAFVLAWTLACAAAAALLIGAPVLAQLLFGWGRMSPQGLAQLATWATVGAWGLLPQALTAVALTILATQHHMQSALAAYAVALGVLLLAGMSGVSDGAQLMGLLNAVLVGVAAASLMALGHDMRRWLPWQAMLAPAGVLIAVAGLLELGLLPASGLDMASALGICALAAIAVVASAWLAGPHLKAALRR